MCFDESTTPENLDPVKKKESKTASWVQTVPCEEQKHLHNTSKSINPRPKKQRNVQKNQETVMDSHFNNFAPATAFNSHPNFINHPQVMLNPYNNQYYEHQAPVLRRPYLFSPIPLFQQQNFIVIDHQRLNCPPVQPNVLAEQPGNHVLNNNHKYFSKSNSSGPVATNPHYTCSSFTPASKDLFQQSALDNLASKKEMTFRSVYEAQDSRARSMPWSDPYSSQKNYFSTNLMHNPSTLNNSAPPMGSPYFFKATNTKKLSLPHSIKLPSFSQLRKDETIKLPDLDASPDRSVLRQPPPLNYRSSKSISISNTAPSQNTSTKQNKNDKQINKKKYVRPLKFSCKVCQKRFHRQDALQTHMNMHLGLKPYKCSICGRCFNAKQNTVRHEKTHGNVAKKEKTE